MANRSQAQFETILCVSMSCVQPPAVEEMFTWVGAGALNNILIVSRKEFQRRALDLILLKVKFNRGDVLGLLCLQEMETFGCGV